MLPSIRCLLAATAMCAGAALHAQTAAPTTTLRYAVGFPGGANPEAARI